jgi:histidinol-phosphate aminotransferase
VNPVLALARPEILDLKPYSHAAWQPSLTRLHANEAPWRPPGDTTAAGVNRYPEPQPKALVARLAALYGVPAGMLLVGRGSDEAIDLLSRIYLRAGTDAILQSPPTFGMYRVAAHIQGAGVVDVPLERERGWRLDPGRLLAAWRPSMKIVYLCSPNNPTANAFELGAIEAVCTALDGKAIVAIDEAYIEWSGRQSLAAWLERFSTLAVLRTLSKAHALAGARIGALLARPELIEVARRVIPPCPRSKRRCAPSSPMHSRRPVRASTPSLRSGITCARAWSGRHWLPRCGRAIRTFFSSTARTPIVSCARARRVEPWCAICARIRRCRTRSGSRWVRAPRTMP